MTTVLGRLLQTEVLENFDGAAEEALFSSFGFVKIKDIVDYEASRSALSELILETERSLGKEAAASLVLAAANTGLARSVIRSLVADATALEADAAPRQSTLFRILQVEADCEAITALLVEALRAQAIGGERSAAAPFIFSALTASQELLEQIGALICAAEMQEPGKILPEGSDPLLTSLSVASRLNRYLGKEGTLSLKAVEASMRRLGVN